MHLEIKRFGRQAHVPLQLHDTSTSAPLILELRSLS